MFWLVKLYIRSDYSESITIRLIPVRIQVDRKDKDKAMQTGLRKPKLIIHPWKQLRHINLSSSANDCLIC